jgi:titin
VVASPGQLATTVGATSTTATVTGLTNGTAYTFTVSATNAIGVSAASAPSNSVTPTGNTAPAAPSNVSATGGDASATVSWTAPTSDGGSPITSYTVTSAPGGITATVAAPATSATVTGLTNGTAYTFTVAATNAVGAGPASAPSNSVTPKPAANVPGAPTNVTAAAGDASATVSWTAPVSDGGSPVTAYSVISLPGGLQAVVSAPSTTAKVTGLTNGTAYTFTVTASNLIGSGPASAPSNSVTPTGADTVAPTVRVTAPAANTATGPTPTFTAVASDNVGVASVGFELSRDGGATWTSAGPADTTSPYSVTVATPLAAGAYQVRAVASDAAGNLGTSAAVPFSVSTTPVPTVAGPVQTLQLGSTTGLAASTTGVPVSLTWSGDAAAAGFELQQSINGGAFTSVSLCAAPPCNVTSKVLLLQPSPVNQKTTTTYQFQVRGVNSSGAAGAWAIGPTFSIPAQDNTTGFSFTGQWSGGNLAGAYNGSVQFSSTAGAFAQNSTPLTGTSLAWVSTLGPDRGKAEVRVDGQLVATVDLYSPTQKTGQLVWSTDGLAATGHTIRITALGQHTAPSTGNRVDVDAYLVLR